MRVLVLGRSGQVARHLQELLPEAHYWGRAELDLAKPESVSAAISELEPDLIVNAAAYTAVDKAETEVDLARLINAEAPAMLARAAAALDVPLVHISTDYVFDGAKVGEYVVDDPCNPINVYGKTKLEGEQAVRALAPKSWILRTSWVFSEYGSNFVKTIVRLAGTRDELRVVADQTGRPTYAADLAELIVCMIRSAGSAERLPHGTYHAVGGTVTSWHAFAQVIVESAFQAGRLDRKPSVMPITTAEYPTAARRPRNSALAPSAELEPALHVDFDWLRGLRRMVQLLAPTAP